MPMRHKHFRPLFFLALAVSVCFVASAAEKSEVKTLTEKPEGFSPKITALLNPAGYHINGPKGAAVDFWFAKELPVQPKFKPTLSIKYPFTPGQFVGALRIPEKTKYSDFRGQKIAAGLYTLRYGRQPIDGNHLGTSETSDFMLALPAKIDTDPKPVKGPDQLSQTSAKSAKSTHPAIFSMLPAEKPAKTATLVHDDNNDHWIINLTVDAKNNDKSVKLPLRFVVFGEALE